MNDDAVMRCPFGEVAMAPDIGKAGEIGIAVFLPAGIVPEHRRHRGEGRGAHKLAFLDEMRECAGLRPERSERAILVGDLNVAPLEHDVWSHKQMLRVVSHTPIECEKLGAAQSAGGWVDCMRVLTPEPEKLYTWWSYRALDWETADRGRRLDHFWTSPALAGGVASIKIAKAYRGAARPSDHVPVTATIEV